MKRLVFIVEGDSEISFINNQIIPFLHHKGFNNSMHAQTIITNRKQHKKGGVINYEYLKNDIKRVFAQGNVIVTTLIDFFRLPTNFPNYTTDANHISEIETGILSNFGNNTDLIPYIQKYEFEALMFSEIDGFEIVMDSDEELEEIKQIISQFPNPEDINSNPNNAPSKRLERIYNYDKVADSELIFEMLDVASIMEKCPRFKDWLERVMDKLGE